MKNIREQILKYSSYFVVLILPLIVISNVASSYVSPKTFFFYGVTEFIFAFWLYSLVVDKSYRLDKRQLFFFIIPLLYIIWISIAGYLAVNPHLSLWSSLDRGTGLLTWYHSFAFSLVVASLVKKEGSVYLDKLLKYFLVGSFILAVSVWLGNEGFNLPFKLLQKSSGGGLIGNSSITAAYLIFSLFISGYFLFIKNLSKNWKIFTYKNIIIILFSPLFINVIGLFDGRGILGSARGATLGILVGAVIFILGYLALSINKIIKILGIIGIFVSIVSFAIGWSELMKPDTYLHNKFISAASSNRFLFWDIAQKSINEHPYFGYGPDNYSIAFQDNFDSKILTDEYHYEAWNDKAHNIYFDTGVSGGYPAIVLYSIFLMSIFYVIYRSYKKEKISQVQASLLSGLLVAYVFQNLFVFDLSITIFVFLMFVGIVYSLQNCADKEKFNKSNIPEFTKYIISSALTILFIISFVYFCALPLNKARNIVRVMSLPSEIRPTKYIELLNGSKVGNDWDTSSFAYQYNTNYKSRIKDIKNDPQKIIYANKDLSAYIDYLEKLSDQNKTDYRLYVTILYLYNTRISITGEKLDEKGMEKFLSVADYARNLAPNDPQVYWNTGLFKLWHRDVQGCLDDYQKAILLDKTNSYSWTLLLNLSKTVKSQELYDYAIKEAKSNIPNFNYN